MIDEETIEAINKGLPHCKITNQFEMLCTICKDTYSLKKHIPTDESGIPIDMFKYFAYWFAEKHADCKTEEKT